jgi:hypothetical protein
MANPIWMEAGHGGVVEILHNAQGNPHYQQMSKLLGHEYIHLISRRSSLLYSNVPNGASDAAVV